MATTFRMKCQGAAKALIVVPCFLVLS